MASDTLTLRDLARQVSPAADAAGIRYTVNQIQHWCDRGLLTYVGLGPADQEVGRGRSRRYPADLVYFCRLLLWLASNGNTIAFMQSAMAELRDHREKTKREGMDDLVAYAITGNMPAIYMVVNLPEGPTWFQRHPVGLDQMASGALVVNLSRVFGERRG